MYVLFKTGMRISEFTGLTLSDLDMKNRTINIDHQLQKKGTLVYIDTTKTYAGKRVIPMTDGVYEAFKNILAARPKFKVEPMIDGYSVFLWFDKDGKPMVAMHWIDIIVFIECSFRRLLFMCVDILTVAIWRSLV